MKTVPILVVTNALALGLVALLWVQQEDLKTQVSSSRNHTSRVAIDTSDSDRIAQLERVVATLRTNGTLDDLAAPADASDAAESVDEGDPIARPGSEGGEEPGMADAEEYDPAEMEPFRRKVRRALELNAHEDRVRRVVTGLDRLVEENRIGSLSDNQKEQVAESVLAYRQRAPQVFRELRRNNNNFEGMERTDVRALFTAAREDLNAQAQKELEDIVPAADAKTIVEMTMNERSMWRGDRGGGGPRFPLTGGARRGGQGQGERRGR